MGLPYAALDVAALLSFRDLGIRAESALLEKIWAEEQTFLVPDLAKSRRTFLLDVAYGRCTFGRNPVSTGNFL